MSVMFAVRFPKPGPIPFLNLHGPINRIQLIPKEMYERLKRAHVSMELVEETTQDEQNQQVRVQPSQPATQKEESKTVANNGRPDGKPSSEGDVTKEEEEPDENPAPAPAPTSEPAPAPRISPAQRRAEHQNRAAKAQQTQEAQKSQDDQK